MKHTHGLIRVGYYNGIKDEIVAVLNRSRQERLKWQGAVFLHVLPSLKHFINQSVISGIYRFCPDSLPRNYIFTRKIIFIFNVL